MKMETIFLQAFCSALSFWTIILFFPETLEAEVGDFQNKNLE